VFAKPCGVFQSRGKVWPDGEDGSPGVDVSRSGRKERNASVSDVPGCITPVVVV
jgi:hypothetical protein